MQCEQFGVYLSKYVDDELKVDERRMVDEHLTACSECRRLLAHFFGNDELLASSLSGDIFGSQVVDSIMTQIQGSHGFTHRLRKTGSRIWGGLVSQPQRWVWAAAAALLLALTMVVIQQLPKLKLVDDQASTIEGLKRELAEKNALIAMDQEDRIRRADETNKEKIMEILGKIPQDIRAFVVAPGKTGVHCLDILEDKGIANFRIKKLINGKEEFSDVFVSTGKPIGNKDYLSGLDFSTHFVLERVGIESQSLIVDGKAVPLGPNKCAYLRGSDGQVLRIFLGEQQEIQ